MLHIPITYNIIISMKIIDLNNIQKYFYMADKPYYKLNKFHGNINNVTGTITNTLSNEINNFHLKMNIDNSIELAIDEDITIIQ
jgi:hypothetical protein